MFSSKDGPFPITKAGRLLVNDEISFPFNKKGVLFSMFFALWASANKLSSKKPQPDFKR
ncbi:hypothetical protein D3C73_978800 [compost metagenome]